MGGFQRLSTRVYSLRCGTHAALGLTSLTYEGWYEMSKTIKDLKAEEAAIHEQMAEISDKQVTLLLQLAENHQERAELHRQAAAEARQYAA